MARVMYNGDRTVSACGTHERCLSFTTVRSFFALRCNDELVLLKYPLIFIDMPDKLLLSVYGSYVRSQSGTQ